MKRIEIIVALDEVGGFGKNGSIPWDLPADRKHFSNLTSGATIIMGRATYNEIASKFPDREGDILPGRKAIVISKSVSELRGATVMRSLREAAMSVASGRIFVIGGSRLFIEALAWAERVFVTVVPGNYDCDRRFPVEFLAARFAPVTTERLEGCLVVEYWRKKK